MLKEMKNNELKYAYFPGCASKQLTSEYDSATRLACKELGIKLIDIPEFSCCGAGVVRETNKAFNESINARNFALAEGKNLDIMTICSTCVLNLRKDLAELKENSKKLDEINGYLKRMKMKCSGKLDIKHFLWTLTDDYGLDKIKEKVKSPLTGLKIATYYGCHILRPSKIVKEHQKTENPDNFEKFVKSLGAIPVDAPGKTDCCGFHIGLTHKKAAAGMSGGYLSSAKEQNPDMIVTNCPFCHMQMDLYQRESEKVLKKKIKIPVIHMSQLLCLALGLSPSQTGLQRHIVQFDDKIWKRFK
jgi:succinate dehydrogenase / fumarate reductase cytochrome b subunit